MFGFKRTTNPIEKASRQRQRAASWRPLLEVLEGRTLLSTIYPVNNGFEVPNLGSGHLALGYGTPIGNQLPSFAGVGWTFVGASGITANGAFDQSGDSNGNSDGTTSSAGQAAFIQYAPGSFPGLALSSISQALTFQAGTASVSFDIQRRDVFGNNPIDVKIDNQDLGTYLATNLRGFNTITTPTVPITAGSHTLYFIGANPSGAGSSNGDVTQFIDNVSVTNNVTEQLVVTAQPPASVNVGAKFDVQISAEDANGQVDKSFTGNVTIAVNYPGTNPGGGTLSGTLTLPVANGVADFNDLTLDKPGTGYTLQATSDMAASATTAPFLVGPLMPKLAVTDGSATYNGLAFAASATVSGVIPGVDDTPSTTLENVGLTLDYLVNPGPSAIDLGASPPVDAGNYQVVASFAGSQDYASASVSTTFTIKPAAPAVVAVNETTPYNGLPQAYPLTVADVIAIGVSNGNDQTPSGIFSFNYSSTSPSYGPTSTPPTNAGTYKVAITFNTIDPNYKTPAKGTASFTISTAKPALGLKGLSPGAGPTGGGTKFTITGTGFQTGVKVLVGGAPATVITSTDTAITALAPTLPLGPADVTVLNADGQKIVAPGAYLVAGVTVSQPPNEMSVYPISSAEAADDFTVSSPETIAAIQFWATASYQGLSEPPGGFLAAFSGVMSWAIHANKAGLPGDILFSGSTSGIVPVETAGLLFGGMHEYIVSFNLAQPVNLAAGAYWLELHEGPTLNTDTTKIGGLNWEAAVPTSTSLFAQAALVSFFFSSPAFAEKIWSF